MAIFRLIQRRLTFVDLNLDDDIAAQYRTAKALYYSWTDDFDFAELQPCLRYTPHSDIGLSVRNAEPAVYVQQGIPSGYLDRSVETLLTLDEQKTLRTVSYGEFERAFKDQENETRKANIVLVNALFNFHPASRPVLWRIFIAQSCLYRLLVGTRSAEVFSLTDEKRGIFDWRRTPDEASDKEVLSDPFEVAHQYLEHRGLLDSPANSYRHIRM
jgi:hypothetical protein